MAQPLVSIRELKSRLSHYLRLIRKGESVVITDHGVPIGRIVPMGRDLGGRLAAMRETGRAQWSGRKLRRRKPVAKLLGRKTVAQLLVEDRASRSWKDFFEAKPSGPSLPRRRDGRPQKRAGLLLKAAAVRRRSARRNGPRASGAG